MADNAVMKAIMTRRSVRAYTPEPLTDEELNMLTDAALASPSGMNSQPWRIVIVKNKALIEELERDVVECFAAAGETEIVERIASRKNKIFYDAPVAIFVPIPEKAGMAAGIVAENISIAAKGIGLDSIILGLPGIAFEGEKGAYWKEKLQFPDGYVFGIAVAVGHAADDGIPHILDYGKVITIS